MGRVSLVKKTSKMCEAPLCQAIGVVYFCLRIEGYGKYQGNGIGMAKSKRQAQKRTDNQ